MGVKRCGQHPRIPRAQAHTLTYPQREKEQPGNSPKTRPLTQPVIPAKAGIQGPKPVTAQSHRSATKAVIPAKAGIQRPEPVSVQSHLIRIALR